MIHYHALLPQSHRAELTAAMRAQNACRSFENDIPLSDWSALCFLASGLTLPGARLIIARVPDGLFTGTLMGMGKVTGCHAACAVIADKSVRMSRVHAGFIGQAALLHAAALGIAGCWVWGAYRKKLPEFPIGETEEVVDIIALGMAPEGRKIARKARAADTFCHPPLKDWPDTLLPVAEAIQLAPVNGSQTPVSLTLDRAGLTFDCPERWYQELGIAMCHAELALTVPHLWVPGITKGEPPLRASLSLR